MIVNRELVVEAQMIVVVAIELVQVLASLRGAPEMYACMYVCMCTALPDSVMTEELKGGPCAHALPSSPSRSPRHGE